MTEEYSSNKDRRQFPRLSSRVYFRLGKSQSLRQRVSNISLGGVRVYSEERLDIDEEVDLELHFPNGFFAKGSARVAWIKELPPDSGSSYEVGLQFLNFSKEAIDELKKTLEDKS